MNRRLDEEIARYAFGDVSAEQAARIERLAENDPELRATLKTYQAMRDGLRQMSPAMDHQLSSARLREEILRRGLEKSSRPFDLRWLIVPVAAAGAFVFGQFALRPPAVAPVLVASTSESAKAADPVEFQPWTSGDAASGVSKIVRDPNDAHESRILAVKSPPKRRTAKSSFVRSSVEVGKVAMKTATEPDALALGSAGPAPSGGAAAEMTLEPPSAFGAGAALSELTAPATRDTAAKESGIVVIQPVRDAATGAYRATEVASSSNVLIGS